MTIEHEARILQIDPNAVADLICFKGGHRIRADHLMRRYVYDISPVDETKWIRLRDTGDEVTLTVKQITNDGISGTTETEVTVSDFTATNDLLAQLGFRPKSYQENYRECFTLEGAHLAIDRWPLIPPYLEIEAASSDQVREVAAFLGFSDTDLVGENTIKIYRRYGYDLNEIPELRFPESETDEERSP